MAASRSFAISSSASASAWLTYTQAPPFLPCARVAAVGSAKMLTRPARYHSRLFMPPHLACTNYYGIAKIGHA